MTPMVQLAHMEEEAPDDGEDIDGKDPDGLDGVTEEFMVCLARAMKDTQQEWEVLFSLQQPRSFHKDCPLVKLPQKNQI